MWNCTAMCTRPKFALACPTSVTNPIVYMFFDQGLVSTIQEVGYSLYHTHLRINNVVSYEVGMAESPHICQASVCIASILTVNLTLF